MNVSFQADDAARWSTATLRQGPGATSFLGVSIDSRTLNSGELFVAIRGPHHDGHRFLDQAIARGASGLMLEQGEQLGEKAREGVAILEVNDGMSALGALAKGHRQNFSGPLVAITGSSGKTTTKEMCAAVLSETGPCLKTQGNLNNEFGLPLTLLRRSPKDKVAVIEMGMNHRGEIARLADIAQPTIGLVTNIGTAHIEFLGSEEEIGNEKGDLFAALPAKGLALVNMDDPQVVQQAERTACPALRYGLSAAADICAKNVRFDPSRKDAAGYRFELSTPVGRGEVSVSGLAMTTVINALAAVATGLAVNATLPQVVQGLLNYQPERGRMAPIALRDGITLIDDSYNANPESLRVALESLAQLSSRGRSLAVLGDMNELGDHAALEHRAAGNRVAELGIDLLFCLGDFGTEIAAGAVDAGLDPQSAHVGTGHDQLSELIQSRMSPQDFILVKGSRGMHMERIIDALLAEDRH
jgi:UDP-N-acetylmuramoyl-tripeptide--D-alanyl-D-alanine ligase